jgi:two-component system, sensor histidine kinase and response regulator
MKIAAHRINSIIAHDLKDSLASIHGVSDILIDNWEDFAKEDTLEIIREIKETSDSALRLLNDLLEWSRRITENAEPKKADFNAGQQISSTIELMDKKCKRKNIEISNMVPPDFVVIGDDNMFAAVVRNLLANAVKSCLDKGKITVSVQPTGNMNIFCIADNGIGMTKTQIEQLFPVDNQSVKHSVSPDYSNGFGLILCRDFIRINGGTFWAESEEGQGTKVFFSFPAQKQ